MRDQVFIDGIPVDVTNRSEVTIDWNSNSRHVITLGNTTELTFVPPPNFTGLDLVVQQGPSGNGRVTWPDNIRWMNNAEPTLNTEPGDTAMCHFTYQNNQFYGTVIQFS